MADLVAGRNPQRYRNPSQVETLGGATNKFDGLQTGTFENHQDVDLKAIPPNGDRPIEVTPTKHLFGNFSD